MNWFVTIIESSVGIAVLMSVLARFMSINKIWKRKHLYSVAESISVAENMLGTFVALPLLIKFAVLDKNIFPAIGIFLLISQMVFFALIGVGFWVKGDRKVGFWSKALSTFKRETKDSGHLINSFTRSKDAGRVMRILVGIARIDKEVAVEEVRLIEKFAKKWRLKTPDLTVGEVVEEPDIVSLRDSMIQYLKTDPPFKQASQLLDISKLIVNADEKVSEEEDMILKELSGLILAYINRENHSERLYEVLLIPQKKEQITTIQALLPDKNLENRRGGRAFSMGKFHSKEYAEMLCRKYIHMNITSVWSLAPGNNIKFSGTC